MSPRTVSRRLLVLGLLALTPLIAPSTARAAVPVATAVPTIGSEFRAGQVLTATTGTWTPSSGLVYGYTWQRCDVDGTLCTTLAGISGNKYTLVSADVGARIKVTVAATNADGTGTKDSPLTPVIGDRQLPVNDAPPAITGPALEGSSLTADDGDWSGPGAPKTTRRWQRCNLAGTTCADIASATGTTYKLLVADIGARIRLEVTATSSDGATKAWSALTDEVKGVAPANTTTKPSLTGPARDGQELKIAANGTWSGTLPQTPRYRWERCTATGEEPCEPIADQTAQTYTLTPTDVGRTVRGVVTMTNVAGSGSAPTAMSARVGPKVPPANTVDPTITGDAVDGETLTSLNGTWTGTPTISYTRAWQRCEADGDPCEDIPNATGTTYALKSGDVGAAFRVRVTAKNPDGEVSETTAATAAVAPALPVNTLAPTLTGTVREGQVLTATAGKWTGTPELAYAYQWQRCTSSTACADIPLAEEPAYRLTADDVGRTVRVAVRATNAAGTSAPRASNPTATVTTGPPVNVALPEITGAQARDGQVWSGTTGTWKGTEPQTYERQWVRCSATGASCVPISGEIGTTYRFAAADVGRTVRLEITALSGLGTTKAQSAASPVVVAQRPEIDGAVTIDGTLRDGQTVTATSTWAGTPTITYTHQWQRCVVTCVDITGATLPTYRLTSTDVGARMKVRVGATNAGGGGTAESAESAAVLADAPVATAAPVLSGTVREGAVLSTTNGTYTGTTPLSYAVRWERCTAAGAGCTPIGATGSTYTLTAADRGVTVRAVVTATNGGGSVENPSAPSAIVAQAPPVIAIAPAVTPDTGLRAGAELSVTQGTWNGSQPMEHTYRWQRCKPGTTTCTDITGAGASTYRTTSADVGFAMRAVVTATNGADSASAPSLVTGVVGTNPPANAVPPAISVDGGVARDGATVRVTTGEWTGLVPMIPSYEWWRCDAAGANCSPIAGASGAFYELRPADVGLTIRGRVIQTNSGGSTGQLSDATATVVAAPPTSVLRPQITGAAAVGKTLTAEPGVWKGTPELRYEYRWQRCDAAGADCADLPGERSATYTLTEADDGLTLRVVVVARNDVGFDEAASLTTAEIQDEPPVEVDGPSIVAPGLVAQGAVLEADPGTWGGAQPVEFTYQWRRCDVALTGCMDIGGATGTTYQLVKDDVGKRIVLALRAANVVGTVSVQTAPTVTVLPEPPANTVLPTIGSTSGFRDGVKLTATNGNWTGAAPIAYSVVWLRCDPEGNACAPVSEVPSTTYTLTSDDVGARMRVRVTATNAATSATVESAATAPVTASAPASTTRPSVLALDGKAAVGGRLRGVAGAWSGTAPMATTLQWQRCASASTAACDDVPGATGAEYVLREADVGMRLRLVVTARNAGGTVTAESTPSDVVPAIPPDTSGVPSINGGPIREGVTLTGQAGTWSGTQPIAIGYTWERCKDAGAASCPKIAGATSQTYTPTSADVGSFLRLTVTAANAGGKGTRSSVPVGVVQGIAPANTIAPVVTARGIKVGGTLTVTNGTWQGTAPMKYEVRWQACDPRGVTCNDVDGGGKPTYKLTEADVNGTLLARPMRAIVVATNVAGTGEAASAIVGNAVGGAGVGAAGGDAAGSAAKKKKQATTSAIPKALRSVKALAQVKKVKVTTRQLQVTFACPKKAKTACGAYGRISTPKMSFDVLAGPIKKGRSKVLKLNLTAAHKASMKGRRRIVLRVRIAAPGTPNLAKLMQKGATVPAKLRGKAKKAKKAKKGKKQAARKKASSRTRSSAKSKPAA